MTDNIAPDEVKKRLILFLRIPSETWTDVLAMLSRRILIQKIAPACYRLKEICDKNVKSVHVIWHAHMFYYNLKNYEPEAKQQLEHLAANKCALAGQFWLGNIKMIEKEWEAVFRHSSDLLRGCQIAFEFGYYSRHAAFKQAFLTQMEQLEPVSIELKLFEPAKIGILGHPTVWKCNRISLDVSRSQRVYADCKIESTTFADINKWLHRHDQVEEIRCMILSVEWANPSINWLFDQCVQDFKQSGKPADRRKFVLVFNYYSWKELANKFERIENHTTGEVLQLQLQHEDVISGGERYRLRRCLAEEVEGQGEFYAKLFKWNGYRDEFNMDEWKSTEVSID